MFTSNPLLGQKLVEGHLPIECHICHILGTMEENVVNERGKSGVVGICVTFSSGFQINLIIPKLLGDGNFIYLILNSSNLLDHFNHLCCLLFSFL